MSEINRAVKGTGDVLPLDSFKWQFVEGKMLETAALYGFNEIRVPVFEHTEVFLRSVGDTTDVVQKEMYTFNDKGGRSVTLRPEFTAGVIRSAIEKGLVNGALPVKAAYVGGCYRYEKPQAGRLREFHQFGVECIGAAAPSADAEVIALAKQVLDSVGIEKISLEINSIGCPECRKDYVAALKAYFEKHVDELCDTCKDRLYRNPMRILDCKSPVCGKIAAGAPVVTDYLCGDCREHFEAVQKYLAAENISFKVNPHIVRGLDYYTKTVFEFVTTALGSQGTVCGGGRYNHLVESVGGKPTPCVGFGLGLERLLMLLDSIGVNIENDDRPDIFVISQNQGLTDKCRDVVMMLRKNGIAADTDNTGRSLKAQFRYADKLAAKYVVVIGDTEASTGVVTVKKLADGTSEQTTIDNLVNYILEKR